MTDPFASLKSVLQGAASALVTPLAVNINAANILPSTPSTGPKSTLESTKTKSIKSLNAPSKSAPTVHTSRSHQPSDITRTIRSTSPIPPRSTRSTSRSTVKTRSSSPPTLRRPSKMTKPKSILRKEPIHASPPPLPYSKFSQPRQAAPGSTPTPSAKSKSTPSSVSQSQKKPRRARHSGLYLSEAGYGRVLHSVLPPDVYRDLMRAKERFAAHNKPSPEEQSLFEALYLLQDQPLMQPHWALDFRGMQVPEVLFETPADTDALLRSVSGNDYHALKALRRSIDMAATVRSLQQSDQANKIPQTIKRELERYVDWSYRDARLNNADFLPNIFVDIVDLFSPHIKTSRYVRQKLATVRRAHQRYWAEYPSTNRGHHHHHQEVPTSPGSHHSKWYRPVTKPPVIYGAFIVGHTVLLATTDAAVDVDGDSWKMILQAEMTYVDEGQALWNAFKFGIATCMAREDILQRLPFLREKTPAEVSDPDL